MANPQPASIQPCYLPDYNAQNPAEVLKGKVLSRHSFDDLNAHGRVVENCDFSGAIFRRAYFRDASFKNCSFKGCRFEGCTFRGVALFQCDFSYAVFTDSMLPSKEIIANLPDRPNLRRELLQVLRANATSMGDYDAQSRFVLEEIAASLDHYWRIVESKQSHYQQKYGRASDRLGALVKFVGLRMDGLLWGHGERPSALMASLTCLLLLASFANLFVVPPATFDGFAPVLFRSVRHSIYLFLDFPEERTYRGLVLVDLSILVVRYMFLGLFIGVVTRKLSHR